MKEEPGIEKVTFSERDILKRKRRALYGELAEVSSRIAAMTTVSDALTSEIERVESLLEEMPSEDVIMVED